MCGLQLELLKLCVLLLHGLDNKWNKVAILYALDAIGTGRHHFWNNFFELLGNDTNLCFAAVLLLVNPLGWRGSAYADVAVVKNTYAFRRGSGAQAVVDLFNSSKIALLGIGCRRNVRVGRRPPLPRSSGVDEASRLSRIIGLTLLLSGIK